MCFALEREMFVSRRPSRVASPRRERALAALLFSRFLVVVVVAEESKQLVF